MCLNFQWLQMSLHSLYCLSSCYEYFLVSHDVAIYSMLDLADPYGRYYGLPFRARYRILDIILLELVLSLPFFLATSSQLEGSVSMMLHTVSHNCTMFETSFFFESVIVLFFILYYFSNCRHLFFETSLILLFLQVSVHDISYANTSATWLETFQNTYS